MYVIPGGIDPNTHFDYEFMGARTVEDFYTGTRAAIVGGTTMIIDYIIPQDGETLLEAYNRMKRKVCTQVVCDYSLHLTLNNVNDLEQLKLISREGNVNSCKLTLGYRDDNIMFDDDEIKRVFEECNNNGILPMVSVQNQSIIEENGKRLRELGITGVEAHYRSRSEYVEGEAIYRACTLAKLADCPLYICNVMSTYTADRLNERQNLTHRKLIGEVIAAAVGSNGMPLLKDNLLSSTYKRKTAYVTSPAIRQDNETSKNLLNYLSNGLLITTASDDCSFLLNDKCKINPVNFQKIPCGVNGVEDRMGVIWEKGVNSGILTPCQFVAITSTNIAKIFNIYPRKGKIEVGSDADIVIWNPNKVKRVSHFTHYQSCDYNIFNGVEIRGNPEVVISGGYVCFNKGVVKVSRGLGRYIKTAPHSPYFYGRDFECD